MATAPPTPAQAPSSTKRLKLNALKKDIASVEMVQNDLVITLKSGRKVLLPDGVNAALASEETWLTFANEDQVSLDELMREAQVSVGSNAPVLWEQIPPNLAVAASAAGGLTTLPLTAVALGALALGGGGKGSSGSGSTNNAGGGQPSVNPNYVVQLSAISTDTGASDSDRITSDNTLTFSGTTNAADGTALQVVLNAGTAQAITLTTTAQGGTWQIAHSSALSDGIYTVDVKLLNASNQVIATATQTTITVATPGSTAPLGADGNSLAGKTIALTSLSPDDGVVNNDFKTSAKTLVFNGTSNAADGTHVVLSIDGALHYTTVMNGVWHFDNTARMLSAGSHQVQVSLADAAGNTAATSPLQEVVVLDSTLTLLSKTTGAIAQTANLVLTFSDTVLPVADKTITLVDESTNAVLETIAVTDTNRVVINGKEVTVNPANNLVIPNTYHALIDSGAFVSSSAMVFGGISGSTEWMFHPVDPATTVTLTGTGVDPSNGINANELTQLVVSGTVVSPNMAAVTDLAIGDITFVSNDGLSRVTVAQADLPTIDPTTHVWTLAHDNAWASQLVSGKTYQVLVQLQSKVLNVPTQSVAQSATVFFDSQAPELTQLSADTSSLNIGQTATFTLTFSEDPGDSLTVQDFTVSGGTIGFLSSTGATRQLVFTPTPQQTNAHVTVAQLKPNSFTDAVGNVGTTNGAVTWPSLNIDTQAPNVLQVVISGADGVTNTSKAGTLNAGDKVLATVTLSEVITLDGSPTFGVDVGGLNKTLRYVSGSGTQTLVFEYTVLAGDLDNVGGLTASANALLLNGGHLKDAAGNHADLATAAILSNDNTLVVDGGASDATRRATQLIQAFADNNQNPQQTVGTAPTLQDYLNAGISANSLTADNVALINNALAGADVGSSEVDTLAELQVLVNAYGSLVNLSDGNDNTTTANTPGFATYATLGITGVSDNTHARLLGDVIDTKLKTDIDTVPELQALADAVAAVMHAAAGATGLTTAQLRLLGLPNVTDDNLPAVLRALGNTADNGSGVDTLSELQTVVATAVTNAANALTVIQDFAELNADSLPAVAGGYVGTPPTLQHFVNAGVSGVNSSNRLAVIDALATQAVAGNDVSTTTQVQALVDAYAGILQLADGFGNTASHALPSAALYTRIGVTDLDAAQASTSSKVGLLGDVIDRKLVSDVDTVKEIQTLVNDVSTLFETAAGGNGLTLQQLIRLGITNVSANTLADVVAAIQATADDGSGVNSFALLSGVITDRLLLVQQALGVISSYAQNNAQPDGPFTGIAPTLDDYANAGVKGVTAGNLSAINNALTTLGVNEASVNTTVEVQALVDAYRVLIASANGQATPTGLRLTADQYLLLGLTGLDNTISNRDARARLLGDVIDRKVLADIDTLSEIQTLQDAVAAVMNAASGVTGLTITQLEKLGITGVTLDNQEVVLQAIADSADDGSDVDSLDELQSLVTAIVNQANAALLVIQNYAQGNTDASLSFGTAPTLQDYAKAGIAGLTSTNLASINTALATAAVDAMRVDSIQEVQSVVNAYLQVFDAADGLDNIHNVSNMRTPYALIGITGVDSDVEYSLLGDVIDVKTTSDVDTTVKLQNLANAVDAVVRAAAGGQDLTQAQLASLSITGVTADNFPLVIKALNDVPVSGARYSTLSDLQSLVTHVVSAAQAALTLIQNYADSNSAPAPATPSGISPIRTTYSDAGVSGVTDTLLGSINDALTTSSVISNSVKTSAGVQSLVDAYKAVLQMADGVGGNAVQLVTLTQLDTLGADTTSLQSASNTTQRLSLFNNLLDGQSATAVDRVNEIDHLISIVNAIQDQAAGIDPSYTLTAADFATIGVQGVSSNNLATWMTRIGSTANDGSEVNTQAKLQQLFYGSLNLTLSAISNDTGISTSDFITSDNTLSFTGTSSAQDGTTVKITLTPSAGASIAFTTTVSNGAWQATYDTALNDGSYTISTQLLDANQAVIRSASSRTLTVDTSDSLLSDGNTDTDVAGHTIDFTAISPDTGFSSSDFKTSSPLLVFSGTSTAVDGAHVAVKIDGTTYYTTVNNGAWQFDNSVNAPLVSGLHNVQADLIDAAGNVVASSVMQDVVIDSTALTIASRTAGAIAQTANLVLTFSDSVVAQNNKYISIWDSSSRTIYETIEATDARITTVGKTVTINPTNDLVLGKNYYGTIDRDAFVSSTGVTFKGLTNITEWTFNPVDPSTTVVLAGVGVTPANGINAAELNNLIVTGTVSSTNGLLVTNLEITRMLFTPTDGSAGFTLTTGMPVVDSVTRVWTLANDSSWTSRLVSGKSYTVSAQLEADIGNTHGVSVADSLSSLIDTTAPTLAITTNATTLKIGQTASLTFTFSEIPAGFTQADIVIPTSGGNPIGSISNFAATDDPMVFTAQFTPAANMALTSSLASVIRTTYTDVVGNAGSQDAASPTVTIDTQAPVVTAIVITGVDSTLSPKLTDLQVGDKIKVTLTLSEATTVDVSGGTPTFDIVVGSTTKSAVYVSGSGTNTLVFYATVALGDTDSAGGITHLANTLTLNGASLRDALGNNAELTTAATLAGTNTLVVETNAAALNTLATAAQNDTASGVNTPVAVYTRAGVTGVTAGNLGAMNSALNSAAVTGTEVDTWMELQSLVDAYKAVLALADGGVSAGTTATAAQFALIGVTGVNTTTVGASTVSANYKASLLSGVLDQKASTAVDTVAEVQSLANAVTAVMLAANGTVSGAGSLTKAQLDAMGITGVTDNNLTEVLAAIANTPDDGTSVNTLPALQYVVDLGANSATQTAMTVIGNFAADNTVSQPVSGAFTYAGTAPTLRDYANAGVTGVDNTNLASVNDALATNAVNRAAVDASSKIQALVDAYNAVFVLSDNTANAGTPLTATQLNAMGANIGNASTSATHLSLLNNVLDPLARTAVDRVSEINAFAAVTNAIQDSVGNLAASNALVAADFTAIGLTGVTSSNLAGIRASIAAQSAGSKVDSISELQALINFYALAPLSLSLQSDTGASNSDKITSNITLTIGAPSAGATNYYSVDAGAFTSTYTAPTSQGAHTVALRQVSSQGYWGQTSSLGFTYDTVAPTTWDMDTTTVGTQTTQSQYFNLSDVTGGKFLTPNMGQISDTDVYAIRLTINTADLDAVNDKLTYSGAAANVNMLVNSILGPTIGGVSDNLAYTNSVANNLKTVKIYRTTGTAFTAAEVQSIEQALKFVTSANGTQGNRSFQITHEDQAGNVSASASVTLTVDTSISAVDLIDTQAGTQASEQSYFNASHVSPSKTIAANMAAPVDSDIVKIAIGMGGVNADSANDKLLFGTVTQALNTAASSGSDQTIGTVSHVNWDYRAVGGTMTLSLTLSGGTAFGASDVQAIEKALRFQTSSAATQGTRTFTFTHTDAAGNVSTAGVETVVVDTGIPAAIDLNNALAGTQNAHAQYYNNAALGTPTTLLSNLVQSSDTDIHTVELVIGGAIDGTHDTLWLDTGNNVKFLLGAASSTLANATLGGVAVKWSYDQPSRTVTLLKQDNSDFTSAQAKSVESAMKFDMSNGGTQGSRTFTLTHVDAAGNRSPSATETVTVDTVVPQAPDMDNVTPGSQTTEHLYYNIDDAHRFSKFVFPSAGQTVDSDIQNITLTLGGAIDGSHDYLWLDTYNGALFRTDSASIADTQSALGGVTAVASVWNYNSTTKTVTISKVGGGTFSSAEVKAIELAIKFETPDYAVSGDRTFTLKHQDSAGNLSPASTSTLTVDLTAPVLDLDTTAASSNDRSVTTLTTVAALNASTLLGNSTSASLTESSDQIVSLKVKVRGLRDGTNEKLVASGVDISANGSTTSGSVTVNTATWNWAYTSVLSAFTFSLSTGVATAAQTLALMETLGYKNAGTGTTDITDGLRQFYISANDVAGNVSAEVVSNMGVNLVAPTLSKKNPLTPLDGNNNHVNGDQFVIAFSEAVQVDGVANTGHWSLLPWASWGTGSTITAVDNITINNISYATNFLVKLGSNALLSLTIKALNLTGGAVGSTTAPYLSLPKVTFGGDMTIECWVYVAGDQTRYARVIDFGRLTDLGAGASGMDEIWLGFEATNNKFAFEVWNGSTKLDRLVSGSTHQYEWNYLTITVGGNSNKDVYFYLNAQTGTDPVTHTALYTNLTLSTAPPSSERDKNFVGKSNWSGDGFFSGSVYDLRIYDDVRTNAEIASDMLGNIDTTDTNLKVYYPFDGNYASGLSGVESASPHNIDASSTSTFTPVGTTLTIDKSYVVDTSGTAATSNLIAVMVQTGSLVGSAATNDSLVGTAGNDFISGQGGNDNLTGNAGADSFAWQLGDTGSDVVTDLKPGEGDMINLSGLLSGKGLSPASSENTLKNYLSLTQSGNDAVLKINLTGDGNFTTSVVKTITFTNGWLSGLNDTLSNLVSKKIINLDYQTATPLVLDLNGDGVHTRSVDDGVAFDMLGNGQLTKTGWSDAHDGLLVLDLNHDGVINNGTELFGSGTRLVDGSRAADGFVALRQYDVNRDGVVDASDAVFAQLQVWVDANGNGKSESAELHTLTELGVTTLQLQTTTSDQLDQGNALKFLSSWLGSDGQSHALTDVIFTNLALNALEAQVALARTAIDLSPTPNASYDVHLRTVLAQPDQPVVITAANTNTVRLEQAAHWSPTDQTATLNQHTYVLWESGQAHVLIDQQAQVQAVL